MVVTVRTILVTLFVRRHVLPKRLSTLFAHEHHVVGLRKSMRLLFGVAFGAIEPLLAAGCSDRNLGIEDMFTVVIEISMTYIEHIGTGVSAPHWIRGGDLSTTFCSTDKEHTKPMRASVLNY